MSRPDDGQTYNAWYYCNDGSIQTYSSDVDTSNFSTTTQEVTFTFPNNTHCDLKTYHVTSFGVVRGRGNGYAVGSYFQAANNNPVPNAGIGGGINLAYTDNYDVKAEIWASPAQLVRTPVLIIPGVLGTDILQGSNTLWLDLGHNFTDVGDEFMDPLEFNSSLNPTSTNLTIGDLIKNPIITKHYYDLIIQEFQNQGYSQGTSSSNSLFLFPYDWRYGISGKYADGRTNVNLLKAKIQEIRDQTHSDKVDVVAHSTGGLLVKQYVMNNPNSNYIGKAVFVGVPNTGAPKAIKTLLEGDSFSIPWLADSEMQKIAQNMPIIYDLMPSGKYYAEKNGPVKIFSGKFLTTSEKELNYDETNSYLKDKGFNSQAVDNAKNLHTVSYDDFDLRTAGVDLYAIDGCKTGTLSQIWDFQNSDGTHVRYDLGDDTPGDGTVPLESSTNLPINESHKYYSLNADHGKMPSQDGIRQEIVNIISGSHLPTQNTQLSPQEDLITQDITKCKLKGKAISVYSPLDIQITDQDGNTAGLVAVGVQNDIPNADFEISGEHKFVYLPNDEGQTYTINVNGTGSGTFTLKDQDISDDTTTQTQVFSNLPVTTALTGQVNLGSTDSLSLDNNGDGVVDQVVQPSSVINAAQSNDLTAPVSTSTITGLMGQVGYYRSNATITLSAIDPIVNNDPSQTSGVLKTVYSLDGSATSTYVNAISVTDEGSHTITFFSTDNAGNNEQPQTIAFTIDKTAPEFIIQFDLNIKDLVFTATDTQATIVSSTSTPIKIKPGPPVKVVDSDNTITATDAAGNTTQIQLKDKNRKKNMKGEIQGLLYNGQAVDISKTVLKFSWTLDKSAQLASLEQHIKSKKDFNIDAVYSNNQTQLSGKDQGGKINKTLAGLVILKVGTSKGDFSWLY